jgi:3-deoxy-D-manno-octulosonic-acid transferase
MRILHYIYLSALSIYLLILRVLSLFGHARAYAFLTMRSPSHLRELSKRTHNLISSNHKWSWFHCASLGEYEQAAPVIEAYISMHPESQILLTLYSPSGHTPLTTTSPPSWLRKNDFITALPMDTPSQVRQFLQAAQYQIAFFASAKYEVWPELINQLTHASPSIPTCVFAVHVLPDAPLLRKTLSGLFLRNTWSNLSTILTQDDASSQLLSQISIKSQPLGDPRADRVCRLALSKEVPEPLKAWKGSSRVIVAGSSWPPEEKALSNLKWDETTKLILAPHHIDDGHINSILNLFNSSALNSPRALLYSEWVLSLNEHEATSMPSILIIDSIGLLSSLYALADLAIIGGGFGAGIHNLLEPAAHGVPMISGPNIGRFREAVKLQNTHSLVICSNQSHLSQTISSSLKSDNRLKLSQTGQLAKDWVESQSGCAEKIAQLLP